RRGRVPHRGRLPSRRDRQPTRAARVRAARPARAAEVLPPHLHADGGAHRPPRRSGGSDRRAAHRGLTASPPSGIVRAMSARAWAGFAAMSTVWGIPYLFIKIAVDDGVPPGVVAWARVVL